MHAELAGAKAIAVMPSVFFKVCGNVAVAIVCRGAPGFPSQCNSNHVVLIGIGDVTHSLRALRS